MEIITDKRKLLPMVLNACEGKTSLPDFQRDFVRPLAEIHGEERRA